MISSFWTFTYVYVLGRHMIVEYYLPLELPMAVGASDGAMITLCSTRYYDNRRCVRYGRHQRDKMWFGIGSE